MLKQKQSSGNFLTVVGGSIRKTVPEGTDGAIQRTYETSDGKKGVKYELIYSAISGKIKSIGFHDGDYGKQITIKIADSQDVYSLSIGVSQPYAEDLMKKLPSLDLEKEVELTPYDFEDEKGKRRRGMTVRQNGESIKNFFYDGSKTINGYPEPEGDTNLFDSDDWKMHFTKCRKFLINYTIDKVAPKIKEDFIGYGNKLDDVQDIAPEDIPF